jgi:hypothetical protein
VEFKQAEPYCASSSPQMTIYPQAQDSFNIKSHANEIVRFFQSGHYACQRSWMEIRLLIVRSLPRTGGSRGLRVCGSPISPPALSPIVTSQSKQ